MNQFRRFCRLLTVPLAFLLVMTAMPAKQVRAGMLATEQVIEVAAADEERHRVREFVDREDVRRQMEALGVDPDEAAARIEGLSDGEIRQIAAYVAEEPSGQGTIAIVLGAVLFILVVLVITDLLGYTHVFPFVRSQH